MSLERTTTFSPAFDKRDPDPSKDYGIGHMTCRMVLKGEKGALHFVWSTGILLPETTEEYARKGDLDWKQLSTDHWFSSSKPRGYDVGYHSLTPQYEGQEINWPTKMRKIDPDLDEDKAAPGEYLSNIAFDKIGDVAPNCDYLGAPCYCDGSAIRAEEWLNILISQGSDKIWEMMEVEYRHLFEDETSDT